MKRFLLVIFLLSSLTSFGQKKYYGNYDYGWNWMRGNFDSVVSIPKGLGSTRTIAGKDTAELRYNKTDSTVYVWTGSQWLQGVRGGGGSIDTAYINGRLNTKIDTLYASSDTVLTASKNGVNWNIPVKGRGSSVIPTLQHVTDAGATTTKEVTVGDLISYGNVAVGQIGAGAALILNNGAISSSIRNDIASNNGKTYQLHDVSSTDDTLANLYDITTYAEPKITASNTIKKYWNGYKNFVSLITDSITEGTNNLWFTNARVNTQLNTYIGDVSFSGGVSSIGSGKVTNSMLAGSISLTTKVTGLLPDANISSATNWNTAYTNRIISLTTTGSSGAAALSSNVLNIPTYTLAGLGGISLTSLSGTSPVTYNNTTGAIGIQVANTTQNGYLSSTDWNAFNNKFSFPSLTSGSVLTTNGSTITQDNANFFYDATKHYLGIKTNSPAFPLDVDSIRTRSILKVQNGTSGGYFTITATNSEIDFAGFNSGGTVNNPIRSYSDINVGANSNINTYINGSLGVSAPAIQSVQDATSSNPIRTIMSATTSGGLIYTVKTAVQDYPLYLSPYSKQVAIGAASSINSSASLDMSTITTGGLLLPSPTTTQRNAISSPATRLLVDNSTTSHIERYNGSTWDQVLMSSDHVKNDDVTILAYQKLGSSVITQTVGLDLSDITASSTFQSQRVYFVPVYVPKPSTIHGVRWYQSAKGVFNQSNYNGIGLYTYSAGTMTRVDSTANDTTIWKTYTSNTWGNKDFSFTYSASEDLYFIGFVYSASSITTAPSLGIAAGMANGVSASDFTNNALLFSFVSGQTSLPTSQAMSGCTTSAVNYYLQLY